MVLDAVTGLAWWERPLLYFRDVMRTNNEKDPLASKNAATLQMCWKFLGNYIKICLIVMTFCSLESNLVSVHKFVEHAYLRRRSDTRRRRQVTGIFSGADLSSSCSALIVLHH